MKNNDDFYIGHNIKIARKYKNSTRIIIVLLALISIGTAFVFSINQNPASNGTFEFGELTELTGTFQRFPYPMLQIKDDDSNVQSVLLIGFGKFGAEPVLEMKEETGELNGKKVTIIGTLIYYDGKTLLQLEPDIRGNITRWDEKSVKPPDPVEHGERVFIGEIIDPKCFFGVMKPGFGKVHRSCAVRCISRGVPPVLVTTNPLGHSEYFLITGTQGEALNSEILQYVGKPAKLTGSVVQFDDWLYLRINPGEIKILDKQSEVYSN